MASVSVQLGLLAIAPDAANADLADVTLASDHATRAGHRVMVQHVVSDTEDAIRETLQRWIADPTIDAILVVGGSDSEAASTAIAPLVTQVRPGFTVCGDTFVFMLPDAVAATMDTLILPQFDPAKKKNLVNQMPRMRSESAPVPMPETSSEATPEPASSDEPSAPHAIPREVPPEKTQGGSGLPARLPAMPAPPREHKRTGANVIARSPASGSPPSAWDPVTKPIDLARLEQEIAVSAGRDDVTRRTDLQKLLPRVPPGADEIDDDDFTHADVVAAPPPLPAAKGEAPTIASATPVTITPRKRVEPAAPSARTTPNPLDVGRATPQPVARITPVPAKLPSVVKPATASRAPASTPPVAAPTPARAPASTPPVATARAKAPATLDEDDDGWPTATTTEIDADRRAPTSPPPTPARTTAATPTTPPKPTAPATPTRAEPIAARVSGSIGVLSDEDLETVDGEGADLDAIRNAAIAQDDEAPTSSRMEPVRVPPAEAPRTRPPTAPPAARSKESSSTGATKTVTASPSSTELERERPATTPPRPRTPTPPPPREASELPRGNFSYPTQKRGMNPVVKVLLFLLVLGAGFAGFVLLFRDKSSPQQQAAAPDDAAQVAVIADAAVEAPDADDEPEIEITPNEPDTKATTTTKVTTATKPPKDAKATRDPKGTKTSAADPKDGKDAQNAGTTTPEPAVTPPTGPSNTAPGAGDDECDETACVLANYDKPCCAKFKPASTADLKPRVGGLPETLDKVMVREGVNGVKPKVQRCGEKSSAKGTVKVDMTVSPAGAVTGASLADSPDATLGECVVAAMKLAKFGKSVSGGTFTYPFVF